MQHLYGCARLKCMRYLRRPVCARHLTSAQSDLLLPRSYFERNKLVYLIPAILYTIFEFHRWRPICHCEPYTSCTSSHHSVHRLLTT